MVTYAPGRGAAERRAGRDQGTGTLRRIGVFVVGLLLALLGAAAWLVSVLLTAPLMLAGVWVWAREFHWAERLLGRVRRWAGSIGRRVKERPLRWGVGTAVSLVGTATAYWLLMT
jgi:hypothetical protein